MLFGVLGVMPLLELEDLEIRSRDGGAFFRLVVVWRFIFTYYFLSDRTC